GAGIDLEDGVLLGLNISQGANPNVTWNFTTELPSVLNISLINQQGVTLYSRAGGQTMPVTNVSIPIGQPITVIIQFNQSMLETQSDNDTNPNFSQISGFQYATKMPVVFYGS